MVVHTAEAAGQPEQDRPGVEVAVAPAALGERVRARRLALGLSLARAAAAAGITPGYYGEIERGRKAPSIQVVQRVAASLECTVAELLERPAPRLPAVVHDARRDLMATLLELTTRLDTEALRSLLDYAGYLVYGRGAARRHRVSSAAPLAEPLFPDAHALVAPRPGFEPRT